MSSPQKVTFPSHNYKPAGHFYHPIAGSVDRSGAAIVIAHPWASIKEQSPAKYARVLTHARFNCLTYDAAYHGESEGEPRDLEDPYQRVEDIKGAVTYLISCKDVDSEKIGVLGICVSGGYAPPQPKRTMARRGYEKDTNKDILKTPLEAAAKDRNSDVGGEKVPIVHVLPQSQRMHQLTFQSHPGT